jgi:hypothetical protein
MVASFPVFVLLGHPDGTFTPNFCMMELVLSSKQWL